MKKIATGCGVILLAIIVMLFSLLMLMGIAMDQGFLPDSIALPKGKIPQRQLDRLVNNGIVTNYEEIEFFYSAAIFSIDVEGNLFTDRRVISYQRREESFDVYEATYDEIEDVVFSKNTSWEYDSTITIKKKNGDWFMLVVSPEGNRDRIFYERLVSKWTAQQR